LIFQWIVPVALLDRNVKPFEETMLPTNDWITTLSRRIPSHPELACELIRGFISQLEAAGWNEADIFAVHMALEESIMNAIKHGNKSDPAKSVEVLAKFSEGRFEAVIVDQGEGFALEDVPDPTLDENLELSSGRGVKLIQTFMDEVEYLDGGRRIRMLKIRS
jgi:serine/threonine-protein kinase RsbW